MEYDDDDEEGYEYEYEVDLVENKPYRANRELVKTPKDEFRTGPLLTPMPNTPLTVKRNNGLIELDQLDTDKSQTDSLSVSCSSTVMEMRNKIKALQEEVDALKAEREIMIKDNHDLREELKRVNARIRYEAWFIEI